MREINQEILFKAQGLYDDKWVYGNLVKRSGEYMIQSNEAENTFYGIKQDTVCQYTGLEDKNGKKIFEGDIVRIPNPKPFNDLICTVKFNDGCFDLVNKEKSFRDYVKCYVCNYNLEVIGNIHDNPELLGGN